MRFNGYEDGREAESVPNKSLIQDHNSAAKLALQPFRLQRLLVGPYGEPVNHF